MCAAFLQEATSSSMESKERKIKSIQRQITYEIILAKTSLLGEAEPVASGVRIVDKHPIFRLQNTIQDLVDEFLLYSSFLHLFSQFLK
jgi:hypothetical protein